MSTPNDENIKKIFSERIKVLIGDESVSAFSRKIGLNQAAIDRYTKKQRSPNAEALVAISSKCGVSVDWLLGLTNSPGKGIKPIQIVEKDPHLGISRTRGYAIARKSKTGYPGHVTVTQLDSKTLTELVDKCVVRRLAAERKAKKTRPYLRATKKVPVILPTE